MNPDADDLNTFLPPPADSPKRKPIQLSEPEFERIRQLASQHSATLRATVVALLDYYEANKNAR